MGNSQSVEDQKIDILKKLYKMNREEMNKLRNELMEERNKTQELNQKLIVDKLKNEQLKLKNRIHHDKFNNVSNFLETIESDLGNNNFKQTKKQSNNYELQNKFTNQPTLNPKFSKRPINNYSSQNTRQNLINKIDSIQLNNNNNSKPKMINTESLTHSRKIQLQNIVKQDDNIFSEESLEEQERREELEFRQRQQQRRNKFQQNRQNNYKNNLNKFGNDIDSHRLLGVSENYSLKELKEKYKKLALLTHPDRQNGSEEKFQLVTKAYMYLLEQLKLKESDKQFTDLKNGSREFIQNQNQNQYMNKNLSFKNENFDVRMFNKIYDENKLYAPTDRGYDDWIKKTQYDTEDIKKNKIFGKKFNVNVFNSVFEKQIKENSKDMVVYTEPEALNMGGEHCMQLGQSNISNFSGGLGDNFTDYRQAFTNTALIDPSMVKRKGYSSIDDIKKDRQNINNYSDEEMRFLEQKKKKEEEEEYKRLQNLSDYDKKISEHYLNVHNRMISNQR